MLLVRKYSWLRTTWFALRGPPVCGFFTINTSPGFASLDSTNCGSETVFSLHSWECGCGKQAVCTLPCRVIWGTWAFEFWSIWGVLEAALLAHWEMAVVKFWGVRTYMDFPLCSGVGSSPHPIVQGSPVF